jgi:sortase (surface protein transpeptidase)
VSVPVLGVGRARDGHLQVPALSQAGDVGWYQYGAIPGRPGNAVMFGRVDTYVGQAVFYNLYQLHRGDQIIVDLGPHDKQRFSVRWVKEVLKGSSAAAEVFRPTRKRQLWLITCGGVFDPVTGSYLSNVIVSARWTGRSR